MKVVALYITCLLKSIVNDRGKKMCYSSVLFYWAGRLFYSQVL